MLRKNRSELAEKFRQKELSSIHEFLAKAIEDLEIHGLAKEHSRLLKQAKEFIATNIEIPKLESAWLNPEDADNWERMILFLAIAREWQNSELSRKKKLLKLLATIFPKNARQSPFAFEKSKRYQEEKAFGLSFNAHLALTCYRYFKEITSDEQLLETISPDPEERKHLRTVDGLLSFAFNASTTGDVSGLYEILMDYLQRFSQVHLKDKNGEDIYEFSLDFAESELIFLNQWLQRHGNMHVPLGSAGKKPFSNITYYYNRKRDIFTKPHERFHLLSSGFTVSAVGSGINEAMTQLLAEEQAFKDKNPARRLDASIHRQLQDTYLFNRKSKNPLKRLAYILSLIPRLYTDDIERQQTYEEEVAVLIKLFRKHPLLRPVFEKRYFDRTKTNVLVFAAEVMNAIGIHGYLNLYLMEPYLSEESPIGHISAQSLADEI